MWANERLNYWNAKLESWPGDQLFASVLGSMPRVWLKAHGWPGRSQLLSYVSHMHAWMQVGPSTPKLWPMSFNHCRRIHDDYEIITVQSQLQEMKDEAFSLSCSRRVKVWSVIPFGFWENRILTLCEGAGMGMLIQQGLFWTSFSPKPNGEIIHVVYGGGRGDLGNDWMFPTVRWADPPSHRRWMAFDGVEKNQESFLKRNFSNDWYVVRKRCRRRSWSCWFVCVFTWAAKGTRCGECRQAERDLRHVRKRRRGFPGWTGSSAPPPWSWETESGSRRPPARLEATWWSCWKHPTFYSALYQKVKGWKMKEETRKGVSI